jgi:hypothetical protein
MHDKGFLNRVEFSGLGQALDGHHLFPIYFLYGGLTGQNRHIVDKNRTGPALLLPAAILGSCKAKIRAQNPQKHPVCIDSHGDGLIIDLELNGFRHIRPLSLGLLIIKERINPQELIIETHNILPWT